MTDKTKRNLRVAGSWGLKGLGVTASIAFPVSAILERFPLVQNGEPSARGIGFGGVVALIVVLINLRRQLWPPVSKFLKEKLHVNSFGALIGWGAAFLIILGLERAAALLPDLRTVCLAGLIGTGAGQLLNTAAGLLHPAKGKVAEGGSA